MSKRRLSQEDEEGEEERPAKVARATAGTLGPLKVTGFIIRAYDADDKAFGTIELLNGNRYADVDDDDLDEAAYNAHETAIDDEFKELLPSYHKQLSRPKDWEAYVVVHEGPYNIRFGHLEEGHREEENRLGARVLAALASDKWAKGDYERRFGGGPVVILGKIDSGLTAVQIADLERLCREHAAILAEEDKAEMVPPPPPLSCPSHRCSSRHKCRTTSPGGSSTPLAMSDSTRSTSGCPAMSARPQPSSSNINRASWLRSARRLARK
jgi:hypothetical protein